MTAEGGARPRLHPQGPQVGGGQVDGVLPYRRQAATAREHSGHGQGRDWDETTIVMADTIVV